MTGKRWIAAIVVLLVVLGGGVAWYLLTPAQQPSVASGPSSAETIGPDEAHTAGNRDARITVIEYAALTCPHCAELNETVIPTLKEKYVQTGKVFYVFRVLPIGAADFKAQGLAACLPKEKYLDVVDLLFRRQNEWGSMQMGEHPGTMDQQPKTDAGLIRMGRAIGLDEKKSRSCMMDSSVHQSVERVAKAGAIRYGLSGVPALIVNGQMVKTPHNAAELSALLDPLLEGK